MTNIRLVVGEGGDVSSNSSSSSSNSNSCTPPETSSTIPEWLLLELQGELAVARYDASSSNDGTMMTTMETLDRRREETTGSFHGATIGTFQLNQGRLQVRIGNHLCDGKIVKLPKPLLVFLRSRAFFERKRREDAYANANAVAMIDTDSAASASAAASASRDPRLHIVAVVRHKWLFNQRPKPIVTGGVLPPHLLATAGATTSGGSGGTSTAIVR